MLLSAMTLATMTLFLSSFAIIVIFLTAVIAAAAAASFAVILTARKVDDFASKFQLLVATFIRPFAVSPPWQRLEIGSGAVFIPHYHSVVWLSSIPRAFDHWSPVNPSPVTLMTLVSGADPHWRVA